MSFSRGLKGKASKVWEDGYNHPFVQELGKGSLDKGKFRFYLVQDYLFLLRYAKVFAMAAVKADSEELMTGFTNAQYFTLTRELELHREYMRGFGISENDVRSAKPSLFNRTYTANMLSFGLTGGLAEILASVFPCAWTYADYAKRLKEQYAENLGGNFYRSWIDAYASGEFSESFEWFYGALDMLVSGLPAGQLGGIEEIFVSSVEFEYLFWDMAYKMQMSY